METQLLPAGLVDDNVEIFDHHGTLKATYRGKVMDIFDLPEKIINRFLDLLIDDIHAQKVFKKKGIKDQGHMLKEYLRCHFGGFDRTADYITSTGEFNREFWACPQKGKCPYKEALCPKMKVKNGYLSRREIHIIQLLAKAKSPKEISRDLFLSLKTVRTHMSNIHEKISTHDAAGIVAFAYKNKLAR